jgi:hypothetical protein
MAWHGIVTNGKSWDSSLKTINFFHWIPVFFFFFYFPFSFQRDWDWADTPYVHDAHSTWLFRMQQISNVFFSVRLWLGFSDM